MSDAVAYETLQRNYELINNQLSAANEKIKELLQKNKELKKALEEKQEENGSSNNFFSHNQDYECRFDDVLTNFDEDLFDTYNDSLFESDDLFSSFDEDETIWDFDNGFIHTDLDDDGFTYTESDDDFSGFYVYDIDTETDTEEDEKKSTNKSQKAVIISTIIGVLIVSALVTLAL